MFGKRILILAAHPDDETVASAAAVGRAQAQGAEIFALYLTHGCIARDVMWPWEREHYDARVARRRAEGEEAAKFLRITPVGWGDARPARHLWRMLPAVFSEIETAVRQHRIDQLWVPAFEGGNADHDALNALGSLFAGPYGRSRPNSPPLAGGVRGGGVKPGAKFQGKRKSSGMPIASSPDLLREGGGIPFVLEFAEYNFAGGKARSQEFPHPNGTEQILSLTPAEQQKKRMALAIYKSEKNNLGYVKTARECWRPLGVYDYTQPPHEGTLWYARFQWVPFHHPRVDFTKPEEVSEAIANFL